MGLNVRLEPGDNPQVIVTGEIIEKMTHEHVKDLLMGEKDLLNRVTKIHGKRPDGIHLSEEDNVPPHLKDSFAEYGWHEGRVVIHPGKARINKATSNLVAVGSALCYNDDDDSNLVAAYEIDEQVTNTIEHSSEWKVGASITQTVTYEVGGDAVGGKVGGSTALTVSSEYGESARTSKEVSTASKGSGTVELEPGERSIVVLSATRGAIDATVTYEHAISGGVFYHFGDHIDGHYLWYAGFSTLYTHDELHRIRREHLSCDVYSKWQIGLRPGGGGPA